MDTHNVKRNCKHLKTRFLWYATCNSCQHKTWKYITVDIIDGPSAGETGIVCGKCAHKYDLVRKGSISLIPIN